MKKINQMKYSFIPIDSCNLCGAKETQFKVLGKRLNKPLGFRPKNKTGITTTIVKCKNCGLIFSNPLPIPEDLQDHYAVSSEEYYKNHDFLVDEANYNCLLAWLKRLMDLKSGIKVLDVGVGIDKFIFSLEKEGLDVYGLEPSESFFREANETIKERKSKVQLKQASVENADFPENFFDFISFGAVLEHLYDPSENIVKALKWLKPKGIIYIEVPSSDWLINKIINFAYRIRGLDYVGNLSPMHMPYHLYEFTLKSFQKHAKQYNYEIADYGYFTCQTFMPKIFDTFLIPYMNLTKTGMQLAVWLKKK